MKAFELCELTEWKDQLERLGRAKPMSTGGVYSTDDSRTADRRSVLLGMLIDEHLKMETAIKIYAEAVVVECVCGDDHDADCRHCRLVEKAHLACPIT